MPLNSTAIMQEVDGGLLFQPVTAEEQLHLTAFVL